MSIHEILQGLLGSIKLTSLVKAKLFFKFVLFSSSAKVLK